MFSDELLGRLKDRRRVAVLTGAGISAESGVPTFRGENGLWKKFRPEELANFDSFMRNPLLVWEWYQYRRHLIENVEPNPGHYALVVMEKRYPDFVLITQNVDGLHRRAGSVKVCELHGNITRNKCVQCGRVSSDTRVDLSSGLPFCQCGGLIRPDVVWFGEMLPAAELNRAILAARDAEVFLSIGTSALVHPAASLPLEAQRSGAYVVEINYEPTPLSGAVQESIRGRSGEVLPLLMKELQKSQRAS